MEPPRTISAGELLEHHWRAMLSFYVGVFGVVSSFFAASQAWPLAVIAVPFAVLASRARGRLYEPEPGVRSSNTARALAALGLVVAFLVYATLATLVLHVIAGAR